MKQQIITYFETDRDFANGKALYGQVPGKSLAFNNALNRMSNTPANCEKLYYELAKLANITERHLGIIMRKPVVKAKSTNKKATDIPKGPAKNTITLPKPTFGAGIKGLAEIKKFAKEKGIKVAGKKRKDFDTAINSWYKNEVAVFFKNKITTQFIASSEKEKQSVKLYDQFSFLSEADCPDVFKILINDLAVTYRKYKEAHPSLFEQLTAKERLQAAKDVMQPYKENKAIWEELKHYQETKKPLGKHPVIKDYLRKIEIKGMDAAQLAKLQGNLTNNINRNKKALEKLEGKKATDKTLLINAQETELQFVEVELKSR